MEELHVTALPGIVMETIALGQWIQSFWGGLSTDCMHRTSILCIRTDMLYSASAVLLKWCKQLLLKQFVKPAPACHIFKEQTSDSKGDCYWLKILFWGWQQCLLLCLLFQLASGSHGREELAKWWSCCLEIHWPLARSEVIPRKDGHQIEVASRINYLCKLQVACR